MIARTAFVSWSLLAALVACEPAIAEPANRVSDRNRQKQAAEQERAELRKKLSDLKEDIVKTEKARGNAADALADSEASISNANRALRELASEQRMPIKASTPANPKPHASGTWLANTLPKMLATCQPVQVKKQLPQR